MSHALIVDDDMDSAEMMALLVATEGFTVATAGTLRDARRQISLQPPDLVLLDLQLPDGSGLELFDDPLMISQPQVVLVTGHATLETSIEALRVGAADYLVKPVDMRYLRRILSNVAGAPVVSPDLDALESQVERDGHFGRLWGRSKPMLRVYEQIARVAPTSITVLVTGESGSGKELVARNVHECSNRSAEPFLAINCGAISPNLIESEIFGHEKGSFTGADRQHLGFFERAHGGTLFLDEITEMSLELQVKLLRVLETGTFMRVGSIQSLKTDVRIIAATNRQPQQAVATGKLREDLYYRLNVFPIEMPSLRERPEDVALLANHFLGEISEREGTVKRFSDAALERLATYHWPGNVRELRNVVQRAYVMTPDRLIGENWLPDAQGRPAMPPKQPQPPAPAPGSSITIAVGTSLASAESQLILATLQRFNNHKERTAAVLGMSLKTLYNRLKEYSAVTPAPSEAAREPHYANDRRIGPDRRRSVDPHPALERRHGAGRRAEDRAAGR